MPNPYKSKGSEHFWRSAITDRPLADVSPIPFKRFAMADGARIATAGSCFAQNVAKHLLASDAVSLVVEEEVADDEPLFSALYGNIYTVRQLLQLFDRAYGTFVPRDDVWVRDDGRFVDPFRPFIPTKGYTTAKEVDVARGKHLEAVQKVFSQCDVFIFTLGLTETWIAAEDGAVFPVAPGVVSEACHTLQYDFHNFTYDECIADLNAFLERLRSVNAGARIILTVSPVPLTATYTDDHVAVATCHSKSILRAACGSAEARHENVFYFPSFEIISGHFTKGAYYADNLRSVTPAGVAHVMRVFEDSYLAERAPDNSRKASDLFDERDSDVICDEGKILDSIGFE